jgi:spore coat polysaccharide biosynthesis predicted glycosyltransferase SpsG
MIFFKAEANSSVGGGHLHRCVSIAKECRSKNVQVGFIFANTPASEQKKVMDEGFSIFHIKKEDEINPKAYLEFAPPGSIIFFETDIPLFYSGELIDELRNKNIKTACYAINDEFKISTDLLLNANIIAKSLNYSTESYTNKLLGPKYMIFHEIFQNKVFNDGNLTFPADLLVYFGNADLLRLTLRFLDILPALSENFKSIKVLVGSLNPDSDTIQNKIKEIQNEKIELIINSPNISEIYEKVNLAFVSGGMSMFELSLFCVSTVVFPSNERENRYVKFMDKQNYVASIECANLLSNNELMKSISLAIINHRNKKYSTKALKELINPNGIQNIVNEFMLSIQ